MMFKQKVVSKRESRNGSKQSLENDVGKAEKKEGEE